MGDGGERDEQEDGAERDEVLVDVRHDEVAQDQEGRPHLDPAHDGELDDESELADVEEVRADVVGREGAPRGVADLTGEKAHAQVVDGQQSSHDVDGELRGQSEGAGGGSNYTSDEFGRFLTGLDIRRSVGRTGVCYDNAMAESFFSAIKNEWLHRFVFTTRAKARRQAIRYIEGFYNNRRLHAALGYRPPLEVLNESLSTPTAA